VKLVEVMFYLVLLVANNFVKTTFGVNFPGGNEISGGEILISPPETA